MSRTRIVKGKITEIIGGDLRYYSETDIVESAAEVYSEKSADKILHGDNPRKPPIGEIIAKCLVKFRPSEKYVGQYGFDWIRIGDTKLSGDCAYKNIICNKSGNVDKNEFTLLKNRFDKILIKERKISYIVPELNLYPGFESQLIMYIDIEEKPEKIILKYDKKYLDLRGKDEITNVSVTSKGNPRKEYLTVYSKEASPKTNYIEAYAVDKNKVEHLVGKMKVLPNIYVYSLPVILIGVTTNLSGIKGNSKTGNYIGEYKNLYKLCRQALVKPNLKYLQKFDVSTSAEVSSFKTSGGIAYQKNVGGNTTYVHHTLEKLFNAKYPEFVNFYKVFFLADSSPGTAGVALLNNKLTIVFTPRNSATTTHELLHAIGLPHSWEKKNKDTNINGFIFRKQQTDNVMDYSTNRYSLWKWQWKKLQSNCTKQKYKP
ncbi:Uncharacterised protein [Chryseobacterium taklimakanense]|uniref:Uncharacterized protein n=1 Tax=Chryseobacterium taklimakanense TaxID=536441 RepID=A0A239WKZ9_9FLAO|nr:hypothetical protein [Chryseobacterium taklimakanense]SNV34879.1 Uncharacterised protein [Chryseobacterium taklimakanense]